ncbi:MAG: helix-turn-helix domain-containing protein [Alphaproteobacteria bacterium]|nr:helix-turn-helix domain-containing protein [Alphaproteobacteria bacterium]MBU1513849.1 helix-turn-helix domain-containing protein [Alphaproteobacteria bacterium]MBU2094506.1 helix-turn-helix domain-containing protein [Alphaproteobacteria bacterium]MBU2151233.1 helix-turn-helix domain-containing protein [Alphaproteobacteria bacterium]MBU2310048.1 helix-turn-helix domain-containing protein [Alphaproteobacteria bacterium]
MDRSQIIETHAFETDVLAPEEQFAAWARFTAHSEVLRQGQGPFHASARFWRLDGMMVSAQTVDPFIMDRDQAHLSATAASHFMVVIPRDGHSRFTAPGVDQECQAGDIILANLRMLGRCDNRGRQQTIAVSIATSFLEAVTGRVEVHGRLRRSPETRLFVSFMTALVQQLPFTPLTAVASLSRILRDLLANAVLSAAPEDSAPQGRAPSLAARARAYIDQQPPGELDVQRMVQALATTRASLYRAFSEDGGVTAYDRLRRLRRLHRAVADPLDRRSLTELGADHGFPDPPHLARLFRRTFGYSMSELRAQLALAPIYNAAPTASAVDLYRQAVADLV